MSNNSQVVSGNSGLIINRKFKKGHCQYEKKRMTHPFCTYFNCQIAVPYECQECMRGIKPAGAKDQSIKIATKILNSK